MGIGLSSLFLSLGKQSDNTGERLGMYCSGPGEGQWELGFMWKQHKVRRTEWRQAIAHRLPESPWLMGTKDQAQPSGLCLWRDAGAVSPRCRILRAGEWRR